MCITLNSPLSDTLRTHITGVLTQHPEWEPSLVGFHVESSWTIGAWDEVRRMVEETSAQNEEVMIARIMLAMKEGEITDIAQSITSARAILGAPIVAAGVGGYRRCYDSIMQLHVVHELEQIYGSMSKLTGSQSRKRTAVAPLTDSLSRRLDATLPTFRVREAVLSMRRTAFALRYAPYMLSYNLLYTNLPKLFSAYCIGRDWSLVVG